MSTRTKGRPSSRKVSGSSYMDNDQFASYLAELRNNRVARPGGARPLPSSSRPSSTNQMNNRMSLGATSFAPSAVSDASSQPAAHQRSQSDAPAGTNKPLPAPMPSSRKPSYGSSFVGSVSSRYSTVTGRGRDYYPEKVPKQAPRPLRPGEAVPTDVYMESGQRWMEKEEAVSLRQAMEALDVKKGYKQPPPQPLVQPTNEEDQHLYNAALNEAAELVYQHQNGIKPPEPGAPYQYKQHLRKNSYAHARTASVGMYGNDIQPTGLARDPSYRSVSDSSASSAEAFGSRRSRFSYGSKRVVSGASDASAGSSNSGNGTSAWASQNTAAAAPAAVAPAARTKGYSGLAGGPRPMMPAVFGTSKTSRTSRRRSSMKRNITGEVEKPFSGDQIYEEPETATPEKGKTVVGGNILQAASKKRVASLGNAKAAQVAAQEKEKAKANDKANNSHPMPSVLSKMVSRYEIHRNPPSQSRNPQYTTNVSTPPKNYLQDREASPVPAGADDVVRMNGVEVRGDDIRQATSFTLKDRNPKLPTPSYVSDNPGRPIVSFDAGWKAPDDEAATDTKPDARHHHHQTATKSVPFVATVTAPSPTPNPSPNPKLNPSPLSSSHQESPHPVPSVAHSWSSTKQQQQQQQQQQSAPQQQHQFRQQCTAPEADAIPLPLRVGPRHAPAAIQVNQPASQLPNNTAPPPSIPTIAITDETAAPPPATKAIRPNPFMRNRSPFVRPQPAVPTISVSEAPAPAPTPSPVPVSSAKKTPIPTIVLPGDADEEIIKPPSASMPSIPIIVTPDDDDGQQQQEQQQQQGNHNSAPPIPIIVTPDEPAATATTAPRSTKSVTSSRPLPAPAVATPSSSTSSSSSSSRRPLPTPGNAISRLRGHWSRAQNPAAPSSVASTSSHNRATALCHECSQPIEGRFVALKGLRCAAGTGDGTSTSGNAGNGTERFHPQCFRCYACGTALEALEISPEPDQFREARLARIAARAAGEILEENPGETMAEDGDERLRFYCHLDWHELFAPRCKHCTTPIVGEHVYALGAHWHVGHFFCAECGDPFPPGATHIEKDGYAWCVGCQTKRTERRAPKCRACGKAVIGAYVQALGAEWHDGCFRCAVCSGGFADGQVFPREGQRGLMQVVCTGCRERELKA